MGVAGDVGEDDCNGAVVDSELDVVRSNTFNKGSKTHSIISTSRSVKLVIG